MVMVWGMDSARHPKKTDETKIEESIRRSKYLLRELSDPEIHVVVPMICVAEVIAPLPDAKRGEFIAELQERFVLQPFDTRAAAIAAKLRELSASAGKDTQYGRLVLKADTLIVASAKSAGATVFYTNDVNCRKLANIIMEGKDLPTIAPDLFIDSEIREGKAESHFWLRFTANSFRFSDSYRATTVSMYPSLCTAYCLLLAMNKMSPSWPSR
jgi:predicted nucleic acid-binding protein